MNRKSRLRLAAIVAIFCTMAMTLTSCKDDTDDLVKPFTGIVTEADMKQAALGLHLDFSGIAVGTDRVRVWDFKDNNRFIAYDYYTDEDYEFAVDTFSGTWKTFVNQTLDWDIDEQIKVSGISVIFDDEVNLPGNLDGLSNFYGFMLPDENNKASDDMFFLSEASLAYLAYNESLSEHPEIYEDEGVDDDEDFDPFLAPTRAGSQSSDNTLENEKVTLLGKVSQKVDLTPQSISTTRGQQQKYEEVNNAVRNETVGTTKNPNDAVFNHDTWRSQNTIQLWDGQKHITVQLPWSPNVTNNNLPTYFCNDITPANGWDLVMNYCGEEVQTIGSSGYHFFAVYNKYTGVLRFFTYIPENFDANNANDHAWEVTLNEQTAQHLDFHYGLPMDKTIANRSALGMNSSEYNVYCTPWVASRSKDGFVTPNAGWWAFDVDLSNYRPGFSAALERLRLQMRAWANSNVTFNSALSAKIQQTENALAYNCNSLTGIVGMFTDVGTNAYKIFSNISSGSWGDAITAGFGLFKTGSNIYTSFREADNDKPKVNVVNTIEGVIDTKGLISGTVNVARVTSPDMPMARFDTKNTTIGQGVWNIKSSPVVYQLDAEFSYRTTTDDGILHQPQFLVIDNNYRNTFSASPCLFDPSSVEVVLNPNVFPKKDIEYVDVQSFCAVRNKTKHDTGNEYRKAFGLSIYNEWTVSKDCVIFEKDNKVYDNPAWDFLHDDSNKMGLTYPKVYKDIERNDKVGYALIGRGDDDALLEPILFGYDESNWGKEIKHYLPSYEVTVQVTVKLKDRKSPLIYTRTYLPEVRWLSFSKAIGVVKHAEEWLNNLKKDGMTSSTAGTTYQEYQLKRMKNVLSFLKPGYDNSMEGVTFEEVIRGGDNVSNMFDGNLNTEWAPSIKARVNGSYWECGFKASRPINVKSYTLYNCNNWDKYKSEPQLWSLSAKNEKGQWVDIDYRYLEQPGGNSASKTYEVRVPGTYQEFKLKVVNYNGSLSGWKRWLGSDLRLRIAELVFHEN